MRRSRLVTPRGSRRKIPGADSSAWTPGSVKRIPGMRCPVVVVVVVTGSVIAASAVAPSAGSWLSRWTRSRRRLAEKPISRRVGRLVSRLPMATS